MEIAMLNKTIAKAFNRKKKLKNQPANLSQAELNVKYTIKSVSTHDAELQNFLFTLGCYEGEHITVISKIAEHFVISVKDARYSIDMELAEAILI